MRTHTRPRLPLALLGLALALSAACSGENGAASPNEAPVTVFAASSLTDAFTALAADFEAASPGREVALNFGASSTLALQVIEGAPADVLAAADRAQLDSVVEAGEATDVRPFAANELVVIAPAGQSTVATFADLADPGVRLVLAAPEVPAGIYARQVLENASTTGGLGVTFSVRVLENLKSNEPNVRAVLTKVALGEADAGIVYESDAVTAGDDVRAIEIPAAFNVEAQYAIAVLTSAADTESAEAFVSFVLSSQGQAVLQRFGFEAP